MTAAAVAPLAAGDSGRHAALGAALALLVGLVCLIGRVARLGVLADLLSRPLLVGYMTGVALLMIAGQLGKVTGTAVSGDTVPSQLRSFIEHAHHTHWPTAMLAAAVLAFVLLARWRLPRAPSPLVAMLLAAGAATLFGLGHHGVRLLGAVPSGLPAPGLSQLGLADVSALLLPALGIAPVGYSDNALTARAFATRNRYRVDSNQELLALGAANVAAGAIGGFPVSSSGSRTAIADSLGARSQLHSLVTVGSVLAALLFLRPVLARVPIAALGAVVIAAALRLIDGAEFARLARFRRSELVLAVATTAGVALLGPLYGVVFAVGLSIVDLVRRVARPHDGVLGYVPGVAGMHDIADYPDARQVPGLVVYRYDSPLFFANVEDFKRRAQAALNAGTGHPEWFLLNAEAIVEVDISAIDALDELREELARRNVVFAMARVKQDLREPLALAGFISRIGEDRVFMTLPTAVQAYLGRYAGIHGQPPPGIAVDDPPAGPFG